MSKFNYEDIKDNIIVRMFGNDRKINGITMSAEKYGFADCVLSVSIKLNETSEQIMSLPITEEMLIEWGVAAEEVFEKGIANIEYTIKGMYETLKESMFPNGIPDDPIAQMMLPPMEETMWVVSTANKINGAVAIIKAKEELNKRFPNGYIVLPSSVHEVIVVSYNVVMSDNVLRDMVTEINAGVVGEDDRLTNNIYKFVA